MEGNLSPRATEKESTGHSHSLAPDKKQFEKEIRVIDEEIKKREAQLKLIPHHTDQEIASELLTVARALGDIEALHSSASTEVKTTEEELRKLGDRLVQRRDVASKLMVGLKHKTQAGFDGSISKLESQLLSKQFSAQEERKLVMEIENLKKSKEVLKDYTEAKQEVEQLMGDQDERRKRRDSLYRQRTDHRRSVAALRDKQVELRRLQLEEQQRERQALREALKKDIDTLYQKRASIRTSFRQQMSMYLNYKQTEQSHKGEESRRREEDRRATREARLSRRHAEQEVARDRVTEEAWLACKTLISHLTQLAQEDPAPSDGNPPNCTHEEQTTPSGEDHMQDVAMVPMPGRFLRRKGDGEEDEQFVTSRRRSKKDKRKGGASSAKAFRKFNHNATIVSQFALLRLAPPISLSDVPHSISQLRHKLAQCEAKVLGTDSETGDSGVGVEVLSQEELSEYSPKALVTPPLDHVSTDDESLGTTTIAEGSVSMTTDCTSDAITSSTTDPA